MRNIGSIEGNKPAADNTGVWAYGSRVKFTAKPHSDLDMVAFASKEQSQAVANLREAFEESYLPFKVGLFVWDEVPEGFHRNIDFATEITIFNARTNGMKTEGAISREHVTNNATVRNTLISRGITPEELPPEEDVKKVERRLTNQEKKEVKKISSSKKKK